MLNFFRTFVRNSTKSSPAPSGPAEFSPSFRYSAFGLELKSRLPLQGLLPGNDERRPDVSITIGRIQDLDTKKCFRGACFALSKESAIVWLDGIARFSITNGSEIIVDPQSQSSADDPFLRKALLSTPFGLLLIQRGLLPLHSSAIAVPHGAVLFLGVAGSGKSALAAWFFKKSFSVISDEIVPIEFSPTGAALACPGFPSLDLYKDSIKSLQLHQLHEDSLVPGSKHPINCEALFQREKLPVHKVYILQQHSEADILFEEVGGPRKAKAIMHHIYRKAFAKELQGEGKIFNSLMRHFSHVPACIIRYKNVPGNISALGDVVAKDLALW